MNRDAPRPPLPPRALAGVPPSSGAVAGALLRGSLAGALAWLAGEPALRITGDWNPGGPAILDALDLPEIAFTGMAGYTLVFVIAQLPAIAGSWPRREGPPLIGLFAGVTAGVIGQVAGETLFLALGADAPARLVAWAVLGAVLGRAAGGAVLGIDPGRSMLAGAWAGAAGAAAFHAIFLASGSDMFARLGGMVVLGSVLGPGLVPGRVSRDRDPAGDQPNCCVL